MDIKTALLNGKLYEKIYMEIPRGTGSSNEFNQEKVCKSDWALHRSRISPQKRDQHFTGVTKMNFTPCPYDPCRFKWKKNEPFVKL